jgi:hypothetical protein
LYIVMEYVDGGTLLDMIHDRKVSFTEGLAMVRQICSALQYAHEKGIVHRDIKPSNILIHPSGAVKIADFGLANVKEVRGALDEGVSETTLGTPDYVAPEVLVEGANVDHRADIFSVGVLFYKILTGITPRGAIQPPSAAGPGIDRRVDGIIAKAMAQSPANRYQSAASMDRQLEALERTPQASIGQVPGRRRARQARGVTPASMPSAKPRAARAASVPPKARPRARSETAVWVALIVAALLIGGLYFLVSSAKRDSPAPEAPGNRFDPTDPDSFDVGGGAP